MIYLKRIVIFNTLFISFFCTGQNDNFEYKNDSMEEENDIRELEQVRISNIPETVYDYIKELSEKFAVNLDFKNVKTLDKLDEKIFLYGLEKLGDEDLFMISLYLDEFFRQNTETDWALDRFKSKKGYYFVPYLKDKNSKKEFSFYRDVFKGSIENESGYLGLKYFYILELARYKDLELFSKEHIDFFNSFK